jgi:hypothetical protein
MPPELWYLALLIPVLLIILLVPRMKRWNKDAPSDYDPGDD